MDMPDFSWLSGIIESEVLTSPAFWILGLGLDIAFIIGFKLSTAWGADDVVSQTFPWYIKVLLLLASWVIAYGWVWKLK